MSLSSSVPRDSTQGREFLQRRIALFAQVMCLLTFGFFLLIRLLEVIAGEFRPAVLLLPAELAHLAACAVLAAMWLICARSQRSAAALARIDAGGFVLVGAFYSLMGTLAPLAPATREVEGHWWFGAIQSLIMIIALTNAAIARAVLVPSSPRRTLWIVLAATAPTMAGIVYLEGFWAVLPAIKRFTVIGNLAAFAALPVVISTLTSRVIYGLQQRVREATQLGQYTLEEKIGEGGMGAVYRARHALLRRPTAIKLLPPEKAGERNLQRFEREVQFTSLLTHPNTVAIYDYGRTPDGVFYYAMELLDGVDLQELVGVEGPQPPGRVVHILVQVCGALAEAHGVGLIHRDVKPANILLCERGGVRDVAKVVDFGLVKDEAGGGQPGNTEVGAHVITGTPLYLSPEGITEPARVDARSDLYALGAVGYFLVTGRPPFEASSAVEVCSHHLHSTPVPPAERLGRPLPAGLSQILLRCLAKRAEARPPSAVALRAALADSGAPHWGEAESQAWWRAHGAATGRRRPRQDGAGAACAATVAIDLRQR